MSINDTLNLNTIVRLALITYQINPRALLDDFEPLDGDVLGVTKAEADEEEHFNGSRNNSDVNKSNTNTWMSFEIYCLLLQPVLRNLWYGTSV